MTFPRHKILLQLFKTLAFIINVFCLFFPLTYNDMSVGVVVMEMGFEQGICVGVVHLRWRVDQRSIPAHPELHSPGMLSASLAWRLTEPL